MTTTTTAPKTSTCTLKFSGSKFTVTSPTKVTISIDLTDASINLMTSTEQNLIYSLEEASLPGREFSAELTWSEMALLRDLAQKQAPKTISQMETKVANAVHQNLLSTTSGTDTSSPEALAVTRREAITKKADREYLYLQYDIPVANRNVTNPSYLLWPFGFRMTESCWCIPADKIDSPILQHLFKLWDRENIKYFVAPFGAAAQDKLLAKALDELDAEIRRQHASLIYRLESASKRYEEARTEIEAKIGRGEEVTEKELTHPQTYHVNTVRSVLQGAAKNLSAAIKCAETFDLTENVKDLLDAVKLAIQSQADAFNAQARAKGFKPAKV